MLNYFQTAHRRFVILLCFLTSLLSENQTFADWNYSPALNRTDTDQPTQFEIETAVAQAQSQGRIILVSDNAPLDIPQAMQQVTNFPVTFRLSRSGINYDITLISMDFQTDGAYLTIGASFNLPGSDIKLYFGGKNIKASASAGFNGDLKILKSSLSTIADIDQQVITACKSELFIEFPLPAFNNNMQMALGAETSLSFQCGTFKKLKLSGYLKTKAFIETEDPAGKILSGPAFFWFDTDQVTDWTDMLFAAHATQGFHAADYSDLGFHFPENAAIWIDLSDVRNTSQIPDCAKTAWKGIFFESFQSRLPLFLHTKASPAAILVQANNLFLDGQGLSGSVALKKTFALNEGYTSGDCPFELSLDSFKAGFSCGTFLGADMEGKMNIPSANIQPQSYTIAYKIPDKHYDLQFAPGADLSLANFNISGNQLNITAQYSGVKYSNNEPNCIQKPKADLSITLRKEQGGTDLSKNESFNLCADLHNLSNQNIFSARVKIDLPDCLEFTGPAWGIPQSDPASGVFYSELWYNPQTREVSNLCHADQIAEGSCRNYRGIPIASQATSSFCFSVKSTTSSAVFVKANITELKDQSGKNITELSTTEQAGLSFNASAASLSVSKTTLSLASTAVSETISIQADQWTSQASDSWIQLDKSSGTSTDLTISLKENLSASPRYGSLSISAGCGLTQTIQITQAATKNCPSVSLAANKPFCGETLQLSSALVPVTAKNLVSNGDFEAGDSGFSAESFHVFNPATGGTAAYIVSDNPKAIMPFIETDCSHSGKVMAVAASFQPAATFWSQSLNVSPNTDYNISLKATQLGSYDNANVAVWFEMDGKRLPIGGSTTSCNWTLFNGSWKL